MLVLIKRCLDLLALYLYLNKGEEGIMNQTMFPIIITVVVAHFLALLSPGPDFMLIVKCGIKNETRNAFRTI